MDSSSVNGMCRCCASEGAFKDIKTSYHWMGEEEVYGDMLRECFDVNLSSAEHGGICEVCITQLRNAANFKKQVLHTESQFKQHLRSKGFKAAQVKEEMSGFDDNDSDDMDNVDDEDYVPDYEVPIKTESESEEKPKKRAAKPATTRSKKSKSNDGEAAVKSISCETSDIKIKMEEIKTGAVRSLVLKKADKTSTQNLSVDTKPTVPKRKLPPMADKPKNKAELRKHLHNLKTILLHSNATPIQSHIGVGYMCGYCSVYFPDLEDLKRHTLQTHTDAEKSHYMEKTAMYDFYVKLDITNLRCLLCQKDIDRLEFLMDHLVTDHAMKIFKDINNHMLPFKFKDGAFVCVICARKYESFKLIQEHMSTHYNNYVCETCNAPFVCRRLMSGHITRTHGSGQFKCTFCEKVFITKMKRRVHEKAVHIDGHKRSKCPYCDEKFKTHSYRLKHMVEEHGVEPRVLKCNACDKQFNSREGLTQHTKRDHLMQRPYACKSCDKSFFALKTLKSHILSHTGERDYQCDVCKKAYGRKYTLIEHMRIHANDRRFKCDQCGQTFVQKCSWKSHMRSKHGKIV